MHDEVSGKFDVELFAGFGSASDYFGVGVRLLGCKDFVAVFRRICPLLSPPMSTILNFFFDFNGHYFGHKL